MSAKINTITKFIPRLTRAEHVVERGIIYFGILIFLKTPPRYTILPIPWLVDSLKKLQRTVPSNNDTA